MTNKPAQEIYLKIPLYDESGNPPPAPVTVAPSWRDRLQPIYEACHDRNRSMADISRMIGDLQLLADEGESARGACK